MFNLRLKLLLGSVILALIPLGVAGTSLIRITRQELISAANDEMRLAANELALEIDSLYVGAWRSTLRMIAASFDNQDLGPVEKVAVLNSIKKADDFVAVQVAVEGFDEPLIVVKDELSGKVSAAGLDPAEVLGVSSDTIGELLADSPVFFGDLSFVPEIDLWLITVVMPLEQPISGRRATLAARVNLERLAARIDDHSFNERGAIFLVDDQGRKLFDPERTDLSGHEVVRSVVDLLRSGSRAAGVFPFSLPSGERMLGCHSSSMYLDWGIVLQSPEAVAYRGISTMVRQLLTWLVIGLGVAVVGAIVYSSRIARRVSAIGVAMEEVGSGNLDFQIPTTRSRDEIGRLFGRLEAMVEDLRKAREVEFENLQLEKAAHKAEAASTAKSEFLANMSHEIRTPMNGVIATAEMLLDSEEDEGRRDYLEMILFSGRTLLSLINDILDFSKIEAGRLEMEVAPFNLRQTLENSLKMLRPGAHKKGLDIRLEMARDMPNRLSGDPLRLQQVLVNLVGNAVKFTDEGEIRLEVEQVRRDEEKATLLFRVSDTGIGISKDRQEAIFESFVQADQSMTRRYGGTGLGLSISSNLIELMGGRLEIDSEPGQGSAFYFSVVFDLQDPQDAFGEPSEDGVRTESSAEGQTAANGRSLNILLAEDNPINQKITKAVLEKHGHRVEVVGDGRLAVEAFRTGTFDLILMDVQMPALDGLGATVAIRSIEEGTGRQIPIVAMTAHTSQGHQQECVQAGMNDFLSKPISAGSLAQVISRAVGD
ncbi:MAG: ATP-binding protein [Acidobacteriota bacterium]